MSAPINQIQSPDDEDEDQTEETHDLVHHSENKDSAIKVAVQEPFLSYYNHDFEQAKDFPGAVSTASTPLKISYNTLIKEGFDLASQKMKPKKRTAEVVDGGRVVRATGRKDRHSKVRTASGPRDRRVRLSPRTAIQFYDVQDRLGYDRPSKAIDWLINEAKNAIDALEEQPILKFSEPNVVEIHSPWIPNHKQEQDDSLVSGFSCFANEAAALEAYLDQDFNSSRNTCEIICPNSHGFCSALNVEANWEMAALQKMFSWNRGNESNRGGGGGGAEYSSGNTLPVAQPISGHVNLFSQREPLQSSVINYSPMNNDVSGFNFSNELSKIAASATIKQGENSKKLI